MPNRWLITLFSDVKSNLDFIHFLVDGFCPELVVIFSIHGMSFLNSFRTRKDEFMCPFVIPGVYSMDNFISFVKCERNIPFKGWFLFNTNSYCVFSYFHRV